MPEHPAEGVPLGTDGPLAMDDRAVQTALAWRSKVHDLRCWPPYFDAVVSGAKPFEVRRADRSFQPGDLLLLHEWSEETGYTNREVARVITYVLRDGERFGVQSGFVVLGLAVPDA